MQDINKLIIVVEGGVLTSVMIQRKDGSSRPLDFVLVDYDTDGEAPEKLTPVIQADGRTELAFVARGRTDELTITIPAFNVTKGA